MLHLCKVLENISKEMISRHFGKEIMHPQQYGFTKNKFSHILSQFPKGEGQRRDCLAVVPVPNSSSLSLPKCRK